MSNELEPYEDRTRSGVYLYLMGALVVGGLFGTITPIMGIVVVLAAIGLWFAPIG